MAYFGIQIPKSSYVGRAYSYNPYLGIRAARLEPLAGDPFVFIHLPRAGFDIDRYDLASMLRLNVRTNVSVISLVIAPGKFSFRVA